MTSISSMAPILPPATIGMLGGGQLGRYALIAARVMGYRTALLDPAFDAPAGAVADHHLLAEYEDPEALDELAGMCAVVTTEFENPPASSLERLSARTAVTPAPATVAVAQDRIAEKSFLERIGVPVGPWATVMTESDIAAIAALVGFPAVVKTARFGYDGKGQRRVANETELAEVWAELNAVPCTVERLLDLQAEVSVVLARSAAGEAATFPVGDNVHVNGVLDLTVVPARVDREVAERATSIATKIAAAFDYVGVLGVEFFVADNQVVVNEIAPRCHNSGHWTLNGAVTSQFEQQIRAICGLPLGDTALVHPAVAMVNLLGDLWRASEPRWHRSLTATDALHLYGKAEPRPGRKMGHLTAWAATPSAAAAAAIAARTRL